jgi:methionyl-tRNA formyltransferase
MFLSHLIRRGFSQMPPERFNLLFFGTDSIAKEVLQALYMSSKDTSLLGNLEVVTTQETEGKRNLHQVKTFCAEKNIRKSLKFRIKSSFSSASF